MKPLFLLKYCFIKELKKNLATDYSQKSEIRSTKSETNSNFSNLNVQNKTPYRPNGDRKTTSLYNGAKMRVWYKKSVNRRERRERRDKISHCWVKS